MTIEIPQGYACEAAENCACAKSSVNIKSCARVRPIPAPTPRNPGEPESAEKRLTEGRSMMEAADQRIERALRMYENTYNAFQRAPREPSLRRRLILAFSELSQAQFEMEHAFTFVPPKPEN